MAHTIENALAVMRAQHRIAFREYIRAMERKDEEALIRLRTELVTLLGAIMTIEDSDVFDDLAEIYEDEIYAE